MIDFDSFVEDWVESWNAHDLERILSHYATEAIHLSPVAQSRIGDGRVVGIEALRRYWGAGLATQPNLKFELLNVFAGHNSVTALYTNHRGQTAAETFEFGPNEKILRSYACYR